MTVVSFTEYTPVPRFDGQPWTQVNIEEGTVSDGPWTMIDSIVLSPVDADPTQPMSRSFTTENATLQYGWYRVSFADASGDSIYTDPVYNSKASDYQPTVKQVATHILARTVNQYGVRQGTFTTDTTPTAAEVEQIIALTMPEIADIIGDDIPEYLWDDAESVASIRAAMQTEIAFFPEQVSSDRSPYKLLKDKYEAAVENLRQQVAAAEEGQTGAVIGGSGNRPSWYFPSNGKWLEKVW